MTNDAVPVTQADEVLAEVIAKEGPRILRGIYRVELTELLARHRGSTAVMDETISCGVSNDDIAKMRELIEHTERHLPKMPWRVIPSDGKPTIAGRERSGNLFRGYIATWKEADLACLAVNSLPSLLDEVEMLRTIVFDALKYRTAGGMRKALEPALFAAHRAAHVAHASLSQTPATPMGVEGEGE